VRSREALADTPVPPPTRAPGSARRNPGRARDRRPGGARIAGSDELAGRPAARANAPAKSPDPPGPGNPFKTFPSSPTLVAEGYNLYQSGCSSCHGIALGGTRGAAPSLVGVGPRPVDFYLSTGRMPLENPRDQPMRSPPPYTRLMAGRDRTPAQRRHGRGSHRRGRSLGRAGLRAARRDRTGLGVPGAAVAHRPQRRVLPEFIKVDTFRKL